jgi:hypothetical protein
MNLLAALAGGFVGTLVITTLLQLATELRLTRVDITVSLLGTAFNRGARRGEGGRLRHLLRWPGSPSRSSTGPCSRPSARRRWCWALLFGLLHGLFLGAVVMNILLPAVHPRMGSSSSAANDGSLIEPPGFMMLNYGARRPPCRWWRTRPTARSWAGSSPPPAEAPRTRSGADARSAHRRPAARSPAPAAYARGEPKHRVDRGGGRHQRGGRQVPEESRCRSPVSIR